MAAAAAPSSSPVFCDRAPALSAGQQDKLLRFAALVRQQLEDSGEAIALVSRTGVSLERFHVRYSHAGFALRRSPNTPWSVRQLYYACDEGRPRLFDQGLPGFVFGGDDPEEGYVSLVLMPTSSAEPLEKAALDDDRATRLLAGRYSADAQPFSVQYQNCNQWVAEMLASAWGGLDEGEHLRERAQAWLARLGYQPQPLELGSPWVLAAGAFVPLVHLDDQSPQDLGRLQVRTSLPRSLEDFVRWRVPGARRIELCHRGSQVVIHAGWSPLADGCVAGADDRTLLLD